MRPASAGRLLGVVAAAILAAGCMPTAPVRMDALTALETSSRNEELKKLKVAVYYSENTRNALSYVAQMKASAGPFSGQIDPDDAALLHRVRDVLDAAFGQTVTVKAPSEAREQGAQLVAVVDLYAQIKTVSFRTTSLDVDVDFRTPDLQPVAVVRGRGQGMVPYPAFNPRWTASADAALRGYTVALSTNAELAAFAAKAAPAVAAEPARAAAAPAPAFRSDVEAPAFRLPEDADKFALVVGVENYSALPAAEYAARDARAVKAHLLALGYPERNIVLLTDQEAGRAGIVKYLEAWLPRNTDEKSKVFVYFSGHGAPGPTDGQAYLVPWDGDPKFLEETGYPIPRLYAKLNALKARSVLLAMDACFSGTGGRSVIAKGTRPLVTKIDTGASAAGRVSALTASSSEETTGVNEAAGHGIFTYYLLKELDRADGKNSFRSLYDGLSPRVRDAARRDNRDQTPQLIGSGEASL